MSRTSTCYECTPPKMCPGREGKAIHMERAHPDISPPKHLAEVEVNKLGLKFGPRSNGNVTPHTLVPRPVTEGGLGNLCDSQFAKWFETELLGDRGAVEGMIRILLRCNTPRSWILKAYEETRQIQLEGGQKFSPDGRWVSWGGNPGLDDQLHYAKTLEEALNYTREYQIPDEYFDTTSVEREYTDCLSTMTTVFHKRLRYLPGVKRILRRNQKNIEQRCKLGW